MYLYLLRGLTITRPNQVMDSKGRRMPRECDNVFMGRLWRSGQYEDIYLKQYDTVSALFRGLDAYFAFYNQAWPHQGLGHAGVTQDNRGDRTVTRSTTPTRGHAPTVGSSLNPVRFDDFGSYF